MIDGVQIKKLKPIKDDRGLLMEFMRDDEPIFDRFGQVYMTLVKRGTVKAWHFHEKQDDHFVCVEGKALVGLYDMRKESKTYGVAMDFILHAPDIDGSEEANNGQGNHLLIKIPKGVAHGFTATDCAQAKIVNIPTRHYDYSEPDEIRFPWNSEDINYQWPDEVTSGG